MQNDDLISRSVLLQKIKEEYDLNYGEILINPERFYDMVEDMPTAYDVGKVEAQLEEMRKCDEGAGFCNHCQRTWCPIELLDADETVKIVRNGGKE